MKYYPVFLDVRGKRCVVVGGGEVAQRKVEVLLKAGAYVEVISPDITEKLARWKEEGRIKYIKKSYAPGDLKGAFLVIASTDSNETNRKVASECQSSNIPVNVVDDPEKCTFILPSIVERGDLLIAISTSGSSPALSKRIRQELEGIYGDEYAQFLDIMRKIRLSILKNPERSISMEDILNRLMESRIIELLKKGDRERTREIMKDIVGSDLSTGEI